jgi:diaminopimelate epimerase
VEVTRSTNTGPHGTACLRFTKHHGAGNDFLVILQPPAGAIGADEVRALCDRHRGVGADGLIVGLHGCDGAELEMILRNADGSSAEMSGNGIRCLVQAAVAAQMTRPGTVVVDTGAGRKQVEYQDLGDGLGWAEVDMGPVRLLGDLPLDEPPASLAAQGKVEKACEVNVGNPHIVLLAAENPPDVSVVGPVIERAVDGGTNVEVVRALGDSSIEIEVWERGVGVTGSCGTGACAAAAATRSWGLVGDDIEVKSGGGALRVKLGPGGVTLCGPARMIGELTVDRVLLSALVDERREEVVAAP